METAPLHNELAEGPEGGQAYWLTTGDGVRIRAASWPGGDKGTVLLFPGRTEYIEKYGRTAADFSARGYGTVAVDWRGQGLADRLAKDPMLGHVGESKDYQLDVDAVVRMAYELELPKPWYLLGHSMGGGIGLRALHEGLPVEAAAFSGPMWGIGMSWYLRPVAWVVSFSSRFVGMDKTYAPGTVPLSYVLNNPFEGNSLTSDLDYWEYMKRQITVEEGFRLGGPSLRWLYNALVETRALRQMKPPKVRTATFLGEQDIIIQKKSVHSVMSEWTNGALRLVHDAKHEFPMELPHIRDNFMDTLDELFSNRAGL